MRELVRREQGCCAFLRFTVREDRDAVRLTIEAPMQVEETEGGPMPAYEFEPEPDELLDALLPKYINTRIYAALIDSAASESASRRRAMKSATDNAEEMIKTLTR